jgi:Tfp pilus assembly protein PilO
MKLNLKIASASKYGKSVPVGFKVFVVPVIVLIVIFAVSLLVIRPKINDILKIRKEITQNQQKLDKLDKKLSSLKVLGKEEIKTQLKTLSAAIPSAKDPANLVITIEKLAADSSITLESFSLTPGGISTQSAQTDKTTDRMDFKLALRGTYQSLKDFLANSLKTVRIIAVQSISVSAGGETGELDFATELSSFYNPLPKITSEPESAIEELTRDELELIENLGQTAQFNQPESATYSARPNPFAPF